MIDGINILSTTEVIEGNSVIQFIQLIAIFMVILGIVLVFNGITKVILSDFFWGLFIIIIGIILIIHFFPNNDRFKTVYKVTIDDSVSINEFNKKYEIINQDGLIYTIKEKEVEH